MKAISYPIYAANIITAYLECIKKESKNIRSLRDAEPLHRLRIATRRLRAALTIFENLFLHQELKKWKKEIRRLGRALGAARDLDVQLRFLKSFQSKNTACAADLEFLVRILHKKRSEAQKVVVSAVCKTAQKNTLNAITEYLTTLRTSNKKVSRTNLSFEIRETISHRLADLLSYRRYVNQPRQSKKLHEMRIAAKQLRYTLEIFEQLSRRKLHRFAVLTRRIQDTLGDLHELDVWLITLPHLTRECGIHRTKAAVMLRQKCTALRQTSYVQFVNLWNETTRKKIWPQLKAAI